MSRTYEERPRERVTPDAWFCAACGTRCEPLPVERLYDRAEICALVPVKYSTLRRLVWQHKDRLSPPKYIGPKRRALRMFTADDVRTLRAIRVRSHQ